ncbi:MAG TPA: class I SAM-dependent methyltransferase [Candidatus Polarisedimenticolia bacterium]|nr:class I SAM-dependent methyltransferase [Candidatus Polarisedimenticolia bacterium]
MYRDFAELHEARHWWFVGRRRILASLIAAWLPPRRDLRILDIGCGTGGMIPLLSEHGQVTGIDPAEAAIRYSKQRYDGAAELLRMDFPAQVPAFRDFDLVTLFDVLEHLDDDALALARAGSLLRGGGLLLITVPAHRCLWSPHDEINQHRRRYGRSELRARLEQSGFRIEKLSYYNMLLFPIVYAARLLRRHLRPRDRRSDVRIGNDWINDRLADVFGAERHLLKHWELPVGVSLIAMARKPEAASGERG